MLSSQARASPKRIQPAFDWMRWLGRAEGPAVQRAQRQGKTRQQQILRLRARPTRNGSGSEKSRGRFAQDDSMKIPPVVMPIQTYTAVIQHEEPWYVAECPEVGVVSQGRTLNEAVANLRAATGLFL
jgi:hypothetical protein